MLGGMHTLPPRILPPVLLLTALLGGPARAAPQVALYTMGAGDEVFSRYGHAALCVRAEGEESGTCYNYGMTDFSSATRVSLDFVRGRARFWVATQSESGMMSSYKHQDRTLYRQVLPLDEAAATGLAEDLATAALEENRYYKYHHLTDNCTTRVRDHIDQRSSGALSRGSDTPLQKTYRDYARAGFSDAPALLLGTDLMVGRATDFPLTRWQEMFLPDALREEVERRLGVAPVKVYTRKGPPHPGDGTDGWQSWIAAGAVLAGVVSAGKARRWSLALPGLALGLAGLASWAMAIASPEAELRWNEAVLLMWPTDLALPLLSGARLAGYLKLRLATAGLIALGLATGLLHQPLWGLLAFLGLPLGMAALRGAGRAAT